jgi:hypothetical protein
MTTPVRLMDLGGILDRAIQILRARFSLFVGLAMLPGFAQLAEQVATVHPASNTDPSAAHIALVIASYGAAFVFWVANLVLPAIATAAICLAASRINFDETITIRSALGTFKSKGGRLVWLEFLQGLYAGWPLLITVFVSAAAASFSPGPFLQVPVWILGAIPCIALYSRYALAFPASAIEDLSAQSSIERSVRLSEGGRWRVCWGFLLPGGLAVGFTFGSTWLIEGLKAESSFLTRNPIAVAGLEGTVSMLLSLVFIPLSAIILTVLYYDQRIRHEGYDVERLMEQAGMEASPPEPESERGATSGTRSEGTETSEDRQPAELA